MEPVLILLIIIALSGIIGIVYHSCRPLGRKKRTCPLCHVGTVTVEEMMDEWDDPIVVACDECGHVGGW